jgi:hypothetical protein
MCCAPAHTDNRLCHWIESRWPSRWVESHHGSWNHSDWLALLEDLKKSVFWPLDPADVGEVLEAVRVCWHNLRRWKESGWPQRWVEAHHGSWNHADWLGLLEELRRSAFWPLDPGAVGEVLEAIKVEWHNLRRWKESGQARRWVEVRNGEWGQTEWSRLLASLEGSEFWPMQPAAIGATVEELRRQWWNLRRWRDSGRARQWVEAHHGSWGHADWLTFLEDLKTSEFWPLAPEAVGEVLEGLKAEYHRPRRKEEPSADPEHEGGWPSLFDALRQAGLWPLPPQTPPARPTTNLAGASKPASERAIRAVAALVRAAAEGPGWPGEECCRTEPALAGLAW